MNERPAGWYAPIRKTSSGLHLVDGVQIDLFFLNFLLCMVIVGLAFAQGVNRYTLLGLLAAPVGYGLHWLFKKITLDDEWWWEIYREGVTFRMRRARFAKKRSGLMRAI